MSSLLFPSPPSFSSSRPRFLHPKLRTVHPPHLNCSPHPPPQTTTELPIFPLPLVLFPGAVLPLQIFEFRYRIMTHTLLSTDLRFGVLFSDNNNETGVGCVAEIVKHEKLADDRFFIIAKGQTRFRIRNILRSKPYLTATVDYLEDKPTNDDVDQLANEVELLMKDVIRMSNKINGKGGEEEMDLRRDVFPTMFSFFVGSTFEGAPKEQQVLLEMEETAGRLRRERETLRNTLNYLTAAAAVKDVFPTTEQESSSQD